MKTLFILASLIFACSVSTFAQNSAQSSAAATTTDDLAAITRTLNYYIEGGTNRDSATVAKAFMTDGQMIGMRNDTLRIVPLKDYVANVKPGDKVKRSCRIASIQVAGSAATARVELVYEDFMLIDFMTIVWTF